MDNYIAFLDENNLVTQVVKAPNSNQDWAQIFSDKHNCRCLETKKDGSIRHQFAITGFTYYESIDAFIEPSPFPGWVLNQQQKRWEAPVATPTDGMVYHWDEENTSWVFLYDPNDEGTPLDP